MPTPEQLEAIGRLGATALLVAAIAALVLRFVYTRGEVQDRERVWAERLGERTLERDEWKAVAKGSLVERDRLLDVIETLTGKKQP